MRYVESLGLLDHALGAPIRDVCSCNVNPFKASLSSGDSGLSAEARARVLHDNALDLEL